MESGSALNEPMHLGAGAKRDSGVVAQRVSRGGAEALLREARRTALGVEMPGAESRFSPSTTPKRRSLGSASSHSWRRALLGPPRLRGPRRRVAYAGAPLSASA